MPSEIIRIAMTPWSPSTRGRKIELYQARISAYSASTSSPALPPVPHMGTDLNTASMASGATRTDNWSMSKVSESSEALDISWRNALKRSWLCAALNTANTLQRNWRSKPLQTELQSCLPASHNDRKVLSKAEVDIFLKDLIHHLCRNLTEANLHTRTQGCQSC